MIHSQPSRAVAAIQQQDENILLVHQQGPDDPEPFWALPGGKVEEREGVVHALLREIQEETGLVAAYADRLLYLTETTWSHGDATLGFCFLVARWEGRLAIHDPDSLILDLGWFPVSEAADHLRKIPLRNIAEPATAWLSGSEQDGLLWSYHQDPQGTIHLDHKTHFS